MSKQRKLKKGWHIFYQCALDTRDAHIAAYSARSAFFLIVSLIPCIILVLRFLAFTPFSEGQLIDGVRGIFPDSISPLIVRCIREAFASSAMTVPLTILVAVWSAGKGVMAISDGLNCVHDVLETRNYFYLRFRAAFYTVFFLLTLVAILVLQAFGGILGEFVVSKIPRLRGTIRSFFEIKGWISGPMIVILTLVVYTFLPNRRLRFFSQLPGAVFCWIGWTLCSFFFSYYLSVFTGFSNLYGSLTTVVLIMLWFYFVMFIMLLGAELNLWMKRYGLIEKIPGIGKHYAKKEKEFIEKSRLHDLNVMRAREKKIKKIMEEDNERSIGKDS